MQMACKKKKRQGEKKTNLKQNTKLYIKAV